MTLLQPLSDSRARVSILRFSLARTGLLLLAIVAGVAGPVGAQEAELETEVHCLVEPGSGASGSGASGSGASGSGASGSALGLVRKIARFPECADPLAVTLLADGVPFRVDLSPGEGGTPPAPVELHLIRFAGNPEGERTIHRLDFEMARTTQGPSALPEPKRLSGQTPANYAPRFSPSGLAVAWQQIGDDPALQVYESASGKTHRFALSQIGGDDPEAALTGGPPQLSAFDWAPGGEALLFKLKKVPGLHRWKPGSPAAKKAEDLPGADDFSISPDGALMAYRPEGQSGGLELFDIAKKEKLRTLCDPDTHCRDVRWARGAKRLLFRRTEGGGDATHWILVAELLPEGKRRSAVVAVTNPAQSDRLAQREGAGSVAAFSPSGDRVAWFFKGELRVAEIDPLWSGRPAQPKVLMASGDADKSDPVWIDASHILYVRKVGQDFPIALADLAAGTLHNVSGRYELHYDLTRNVTGDRIAYSAFDGEQAVMLSELPADLVKRAASMGEAAQQFTVRLEGQSYPVDASRGATLTLPGAKRLSVRAGGEGLILELH